MGIVPAPADREQGGTKYDWSNFSAGAEQLYPCWGA